MRRLLSKAPPLALDGLARELPGPVGERNAYGLRPKGTILCVATDPSDLQAQFEAVRATGNRATQDVDDPHISAALFAGSPDELLALSPPPGRARRPIVPVHPAPYRRNTWSTRSAQRQHRRRGRQCQPYDFGVGGLAVYGP